MTAGVGVTGPRNAFEDEQGFLKLLNDNQHDPSYDLMLRERWRLETPGILFKSYPVCSAAQAGVELTNILMTKNGLNRDNIARVVCEVPPLVQISLAYEIPKNVREGQFSMPFSVGCMMAYGELGLNQLSETTLTDPVLLDQMKKVQMIVSESLANDPTVPERCPEGAYVSLITNSGKKFKDFLPKPTGMPGNPISDFDLEKKYMDCLSYAGFCRKTAQATISKIKSMEQMTECSTFISELH